MNPLKMIWYYLLFPTLLTVTHAKVTGAGTITYHDYQALPLAALANNPPSCGMPYRDLDLTRITAVQTMNVPTDCGKCLKVSNARNGKFVYVMAVDTGGRGLDLTKPAFGQLFDIADGVGPAKWEQVDGMHCQGIWGKGPKPAPPVEPVKPAPPPPPPPVTSKAPAPAPAPPSVKPPPPPATSKNPLPATTKPEPAKPTPTSSKPLKVLPPVVNYMVPSSNTTHTEEPLIRIPQIETTTSIPHASQEEPTSTTSTTNTTSTTTTTTTSSANTCRISSVFLFFLSLLFLFIK